MGRIPSHTFGRDGGGCAEGLPRRRECVAAQEQERGGQRVGHGDSPNGGGGGGGGGRSRVAPRDPFPTAGIFEYCGGGRKGNNVRNKMVTNPDLMGVQLTWRALKLKTRPF